MWTDDSQQSASESYDDIRLPCAGHLNIIEDDYRQESNGKVDENIDGTDESPECCLV